MDTLEDILDSILVTAVKESRNADGWSCEAKAASYANSYGYDKERYGKIGRQFDSNPNIRVYTVRKTQRFLTLTNADYPVTDSPEPTPTVSREASNLNYKAPEISNTQFEYLKPLIREYLDLSNNYELCRSVIGNVFKKLNLEKKILTHNHYVLWNTGLQSCFSSDIWGYGKADDTGKVWIIKFCDEHSSCAYKLLEKFGQRPLAAEYPESADGAFNPELEIRINAYHIMVDRFYRYPDELKAMIGINCDKNNWKEHRAAIERYRNFLQIHLIGAIERSKRSIRQHRDMPVRMWDYQHNSMDWLMPVDMGIERPQYMALLLEYCTEGDKNYYQAHTIFDRNLAYMNARQIGPVLSSWLTWSGS